MGEFLGNKKETFKVGFASLVQFKVNAESYAFLGLEAVANNAEYTPLTDSVKFEEAEKDEKNGIYKYNVTILKDTKELLIRPTCLAFPEVVSYSPISGVEQYANTPIEITFSMPMEDPETTADQSLFKYPNVYLIYTDSVKNNHDMSAYFEEPVFDVEKKKLRLVPKSVQLSNFIGNTIPSIDIAISFASEIVVKKEGLTLPLKQNEKSNFKIRYKKDMEETPPEKKAFFATGDEIHLSDSPVFKNKKRLNLNTHPILTENTTDDWYFYKQNRIKDSLYIYGKYFDRDSGVSKVIVQQQGCTSNEYSIGTDNLEYQVDEQGNTEFCIKYDLKKFNDAFVITVTVVDACGNPSEEQRFSVINRRSYDNYSRIEFGWNKFTLKDMNFFMYNKTQNLVIDSITHTDINLYIQNYKNSNPNNLKIYFQDFHLKLCERVFSHDKNTKIYCTYTDKNGIEHIEEEFENHVDSDGYWSFDFDVDSLCFTPFVITVEDYFGTRGQINVDPLPKNQLTWHNYSVGKKYAFSSDVYGGRVIIEKNADQSLSYKTYRSPSSSERYFDFVYDDYTPKGYFYNNFYGICSDYIEIKKPTKTVDIEDYEISKDENNHINLTFTFADDTWDDFESIYVRVKKGDDWINSEDFFIDTKETTYTYETKKNYYYDSTKKIDKFLFDEPVSFIFSGATESYALGDDEEVASGNAETNNIVTLDALNEADYDDVPPYIEFEYDGRYSSWDFNLKDANGVGVKKAELTIGDKVYKRTGVRFISVPINEIIQNITDYYEGNYKYSKLDFEYVAYDYNDNVASRTCSFSWGVVDSAKTMMSASPTYVINFNSSTNNLTLNLGGTDKVTIYGWNTNYWNILHDTAGSSFSSSDFAGKWIKIIGYELRTSTWRGPQISYYYTGQRVGTSEKNSFILKTSKDSAIINSNACVFAHTIKTDLPYEKIKDWTFYQWLQYGTEVHCSELNKQNSYDADSYNMSVYTISSEKFDTIQQGQYYVMIAHMGDSRVTTVMSEIMQK